jgi:hypothetical protein
LPLKKTRFQLARFALGGVAACALLLLPSGPTEAHEVPANVAVQIYVRPEGSKLRILVRVPLAAMRDVVLPLKGPGYLDFSRLDRQPQEAARLWIADYIRLYENTQELPEETVVATRITLPSDRSFVSYDSALAGVLSPAAFKRYRSDVEPAPAGRVAGSSHLGRKRTLFDRPDARSSRREHDQRAAFRDTRRNGARVPV